VPSKKPKTILNLNKFEYRSYVFLNTFTKTFNR